MNEEDKKPTEEPIDQPEEQYGVSHAPTPHVVHVKKSPVKKVLVWLLIILLLAGNIALGYLYYEQTKDIDAYKKQVQELQTTIDKNAGAQAPEQPVATTYEATVGKFTLTLPPTNVIIKKLDGGFEGGPATILQVTKYADKENGVVGVDNPISEVIITAVPSTNVGEFATLKKFKDSAFSNLSLTDLQQKNGVTIDGVNAEVYGITELFYTEYYIYENNDIYYKIEAVGADQEPTKTIMQDVIKGFTFN